MPSVLKVYDNPLFKHYNIFEHQKIAEFAATAPAPQRDFHHLLINASSFIWRWWKITSRNDGAKFHPGESRSTYEEFIHDERVHSEIHRVMGQETLDYCLNLANGKLDYIVRMPFTILVNIISYLQLEDVVNLSRTSKFLNEVCNNNELWHEIYMRSTPTKPNETINELANLFGWKKVFFTSKLQLQMQLRRLKLERTNQSGDEEVTTVDDSISDESQSMNNTEEQSESNVRYNYSSTVSPNFINVE